MAVELGLEPVTPPPVLYHGTVERFLPSILATGLRRGSRQYVHLSPDAATAERTGRRRGAPVVLVVDAAGARGGARVPPGLERRLADRRRAARLPAAARLTVVQDRPCAGTRRRRRCPSIGVSTMTSQPASRHAAAIELGVDRPGVVVRVPVGAGAGVVAGAVRVHQVDASGDRADPVDDGVQVLPGRPGVAGVEHEARGRSRRRRPTGGPAGRSVRAIAFSPPAVFSMRIGRPKPPVGRALEGLAPVLDPLPGVVLAVTWPPWTISPFAPIAAAAAACWARILRLGIRILLFVLATFTRYGAWM